MFIDDRRRPRPFCFVILLFFFFAIYSSGFCEDVNEYSLVADPAGDDDDDEDDDDDDFFSISYGTYEL